MESTLWVVVARNLHADESCDRYKVASYLPDKQTAVYNAETVTRVTGKGVAVFPISEDGLGDMVENAFYPWLDNWESFAPEPECLATFFRCMTNELARLFSRQRARFTK